MNNPKEKKSAKGIANRKFTEENKYTWSATIWKNAYIFIHQISKG